MSTWQILNNGLTVAYRIYYEWESDGLHIMEIRENKGERINVSKKKESAFVISVTSESLHLLLALQVI